MFKKVDSFTNEYQLSRTHCVSVCTDCASAMMRVKKFFMSTCKRKQKNLGSYCLLHRE